MSPRIAGCLLTAALSLGCDANSYEDLALEERTGSGSADCGRWRCGFNAAQVNGRSLQSLNLQGVANAAGIRVVGFTPPAGQVPTGFTLTVEGDEFVARRGATTLRRAALVGSKLWVQVELGVVLPVSFAGFEAVPSWAADAEPIAAYTLLFPAVGELLGVKNVCSGSLTDPLASAVTVLGGETYDDAGKTVRADQAGWFTLACAGSAAAKMKLMGYAPQTEFDGSGAPSTVAQRQATLKMITADYCGTGQSYTQTGTPVVWRNQAGSVDGSNWHVPGAVEAVWDEHGARCLGATRITGTQVGCVLPSCAGYSLDDGEWQTQVAP